MSSAQEIETVELTLERAKEHAALGAAVRKLFSNREFKKVFVENYFRDEAARLAGLLGDPSMQGDDERAQVIKSLDTIGVVQAQLRAWVQMGDHAATAIVENNELLDDLRAEEAEEAEEA